MLTLNALFQAEGLDPERIQLIRHKDARLKEKTLFDVWYSEREKFEAYQSVQGPKNSFRVGGLVASFVVTTSNETVFVGLYETFGRRQILEDERLPVLDTPLNQSDYVHDLRLPTDVMRDYVGRLVIEPWKDAINFVQRASGRDPRILEIKRVRQDEPFPGLLSFSRRISELAGIFPTWRERLAEAKGVYLLTFDDGYQYVGSASGAQGFWQRWNEYVQDGTGGNQVLIQDGRDSRRDGTVSILEFTGSHVTRQEIIVREMVWQTKLGSRAKRLDNV
jgi:hypothetical protein